MDTREKGRKGCPGPTWDKQHIQSVKNVQWKLLNYLIKYIRINS